MTMTMANDEEEAFIVDQVLSLRHEVQLHEEATRELSTNKRLAEKRLADAEQALIDYMVANGIKASSVNGTKVSISPTQSVNVPDIELVPDRYIRTKVTKEVNKALINAEKIPPCDWLNYTQGYKLTITNERA